MKTALITGTAQGIGKAIAQHFYDQGYRVIGLDAKEQNRSDWEAITCDLADFVGWDKAKKERWKQSINSSFADAGRLELLVNNAALQVVKPIEKLTGGDWMRTQQINVAAPFFLTQLFLEELRTANGSVVNISSIHQNLTKPGFTAYATSKGALSTLTKAMALELAPKVRVNAIAPAATDTEMLRAGFQSNPDGLSKLAEYHPMQRITEPEEVAKACQFLSEPHSGFITGTILELDGGISKKLSDPEH